VRTGCYRSWASYLIWFPWLEMLTLPTITGGVFMDFDWLTDRMGSNTHLDMIVEQKPFVTMYWIIISKKICTLGSGWNVVRRFLQNGRFCLHWRVCLWIWSQIVTRHLRTPPGILLLGAGISFNDFDALRIVCHDECHKVCITVSRSEFIYRYNRISSKWYE